MRSARFLPEGSELVGADETILWQGRPTVTGLVTRLFHVRAVMGYFAVLAAWNLAQAHSEGFRASTAFVTTSWIGGGALAVAVVFAAMSWVLAMTSRYMITDKRVILQIGLSLPIALTLPLKRIASADLRLYPDGSGDIPLTLGDGKLAYLLIAPHARPWRFKAPQPMLRSVPDARAVAEVLAQALLVASPSGEAMSIEPMAVARPRTVAAPVAA